MTGYSHVSYEIVRAGSRDTLGAHATIAVAVKNPAFVVDSDFVEVEQIALDVAATALPDTSFALDRIVRRRVDCCPRTTA